ncbi:hypothetical protein AB834_05955 [PVC group bacterium (ex Bugula neritina AB1)]|nr:hypothetical protein AB834_05955 [PVC group bacterium (ex Bugula neritina AB1)]
MLKLLKIFSATFLSFIYLFTNIHLSEAFSPVYGDKRIKKSVNLAINSPLRDRVSSLGNIAPRSSVSREYLDSGAREQISESQKNEDKRVKGFLNQTATGMFEKYAQSDAGRDLLQDIYNDLTDRFRHLCVEGQIDKSFILETMWLAASTWQINAPFFWDIESFTNFFKSFTPKQLSDYVYQHFLQKESLSRKEDEDFSHRSPKSEFLSDVEKYIQTNQLYRRYDAPSSEKLYEHALNVAKRSLGDYEDSESLMSNVVRPLVDIELGRFIGENDAELHRNMLSMIEMLSLLNRKAVTGDELGRQNFAKRLYNVMSDHQSRLDERDAKRAAEDTNYQLKTFEELYLEAYPENKDDISKYPSFEGLLKTNLGLFRLTKKWVKVNALIELGQYPLYRRTNSSQLVKVIENIFIFIGIMSLIAGVILINISLAHSIIFIGIGASFLFLINGFKKIILTILYPSQYKSVWIRFLQFGILAAVVTLFIVGTVFLQPVFRTIFSPTGLSDLIVATPYLICMFVFWIGATIFRYRCSDEYQKGKRDFLGFMNKHLLADNKDSNSGRSQEVREMFMKDLARFGKMNKEVYVDLEVAQAKQSGERALSYNAETLVNLYDKLKQSSHVSSFSFFKTNQKKTFYNLDAMIAELVRERESVLHKEAGKLSRLELYNISSKSMACREFAMVQKRKKLLDTTIVANEILTGIDTAAVPHSLNRGLEEVNEAIANVTKTLKSIDDTEIKSFVKEGIAGLTGAKPANLKPFITQFNQKCEQSAQDISQDTREFLRLQFSTIRETHARNQFNLQNIDRQEVDNVNTDRTVGIVQDIWEYVEGRPASFPQEGPANLDGLFRNSEFFKGDGSVLKTMSEYQGSLLHGVHSHGYLVDLKHLSNVSWFYEKFYKDFEVKIRSMDGKFDTQLQKWLFGADENFQELLNENAELKGLFLNALKQLKEEVDSQINENQVENELFHLGSLERISKWLEESQKDISTFPRKRADWIDHFTERWSLRESAGVGELSAEMISQRAKLQKGLRDIRAFLESEADFLNPLKSALDAYIDEYGEYDFQKILVEMEANFVRREGSYESFSYEKISESMNQFYYFFLDERTSLYDVRLNLFKEFYFSMPMAESREMYGSMFNDLSVMRRSIDLANIANASIDSEPVETTNLRGYPARTNWDLTHEELSDIYLKENLGKTWMDKVKEETSSVRDFSLEHGYRYKFQKNIDEMFELNQDESGNVISDPRSWRDIAWIVAKVVLAVSFMGLAAYFFSLFITGGGSFIFFSVSQIYTGLQPFLGTAAFIAPFVALGGIIALTGIAMVLLRQRVKNDFHQDRLKRNSKSGQRFFVPVAFALIGGLIAAVPFFIGPLMTVLMQAPIGPLESFLIMTIAGVFVLVLYEIFQRYKFKKRSFALKAVFSFMIIAVITSSFFTFSPIMALIFTALVFFIRYSCDLIAKKKSYFLGVLILLGAVCCLGGMVVSLMPVLLAQTELGLLQGVALVQKLVTSFAGLPTIAWLYIGLVGAAIVLPIIFILLMKFLPHIRRSSREDILSKAEMIKDMLEAPDINYQFSPDTLSPLGLLEGSFAKQMFDSEIRKLKLMLRRYRKDLKTDKDLINEFETYFREVSGVEVDKKLIHILKLALLSRDRQGSEILARNLDIETRVPASELHNLIDHQGKADFTRRVEKTPKVSLSLWTKFKRYVEENAQTIYFAITFGAAFIMAISFGAMIYYVAGAAGMVMAQIVLSVILVPLLFVLLINNTNLLASYILGRILDIRMIPKVEMPFGLPQPGALTYAIFNVSQANQRKFKGYDAEAEKKRGGFYGYNSMDEWFQIQVQTLQDNPEAVVMIQSNNPRGQEHYLVYEMMMAMLLAERFGWDRVSYVYVGGTWLRKAGKIQDIMRFFSGEYLDDERHSQQMGLHGGRRTLSKRSAFDPEYRVQITLGGEFGDRKDLDSLERQRFDFVKKIQTEFIAAYKDFKQTKDERILRDLAQKYIKPNMADKESQMHRNNGIGMQLMSKKMRERLTKENGRTGIGSMCTNDNDNAWAPGEYRNAMSGMLSRYMAHVGNIQPKAVISNMETSSFATSLGTAAKVLQDINSTSGAVGKTYQDFGKGVKRLTKWVYELANSNALLPHILSHDTQEKDGAPYRHLLHAMGFSIGDESSYLLEGTTPNYLAGAVRTGRWLFGTMQDMKNFSEKRGLFQKWLGFLPIKGYWNELLFFIYLFIGFLTVITNTVLLDSSVFFPSVILFFLFGLSMVMVIVLPKFKDLNLFQVGSKAQFNLVGQELLLSTMIYLNNPLTISKYDMMQVDSMVQEEVAGIPNSPGWTPSAVTEEMLKSPTKKQTLLFLSPQVKLGIIALAILLFTLFLVPSSGLVWSTLLIYLFWSSPLYLSLIVGWYFVWKSGEDRTYFVDTYKKAIDGSVDQGVNLKNTAYGIVDDALDEAWKGFKWDKIYSETPFNRGLFNIYKNRIAAVRSLMDTFKIEDEVKRGQEQERISKLIYAENHSKKNKKTASFLMFFGVGILVAATFAFLQVFLLVGVAAVGDFSLFLLIALASFGVICIIIAGIWKKFNKKSDRLLYFMRAGKNVNDYIYKRRYYVKEILMNVAFLTTFLVGLALVILGTVSATSSIVLFSGFMNPFCIVAGIIFSLLSLFFFFRFSKYDMMMKIFSKRGEKLFTRVNVLKIEIKKDIWSRMKAPHYILFLNALRRKFKNHFSPPVKNEASVSNEINSLERGDGIESANPNFEHLASEVLFDLFSDITLTLEKEKVKQYVLGTPLDKGSFENDWNTKHEILDSLKAYDTALNFYDKANRSHAEERSGISFQEAQYIEKFFENLFFYVDLRGQEDASFEIHPRVRSFYQEIGRFIDREKYLEFKGDFLLQFRESQSSMDDMDNKEDYANSIYTFFLLFINNTQSLRFLSKESLPYKAYSEVMQDLWLGTNQEIMEMRKPHQYNGSFGGALESIFYDEFRDSEFVLKTNMYANELYKNLSSAALPFDRSLWRGILTFTKEETGEVKMTFNKNSGYDINLIREKLVKLFLQSLDKLDGSLFDHSTNLREKIMEIARNDMETLWNIFALSPMVQAAMTAAFFPQNANTLEKSIALTDPQWMHYVELREKFPLIFSLSSFKPSLNKEIDEDVEEYLASMPVSFLEQSPSLLSFYDKDEMRKCTQDDFKKMLAFVWNTALDAKSVDIFYSYVAVLRGAPWYGKEDYKELSNTFDRAVEEHLASGSNEQLFYRKHIMGAKFSSAHSKFFPTTWNGITLWFVVKKLAILAFGTAFFVAFAFCAVQAMQQLSLQIGIIAIGESLMIQGPVFPIFATVSAVTLFLLQTVLSSFYVYEDDDKRKYHLMGNKNRKLSQYFTHAFSSLTLLIALGALYFIPAVSLGAFLGIAAGAMVFYFIIYRLFSRGFDYFFQQRLLKRLSKAMALLKQSRAETTFLKNFKGQRDFLEKFNRFAEPIGSEIPLKGLYVSGELIKNAFNEKIVLFHRLSSTNNRADGDDNDWAWFHNTQDMLRDIDQLPSSYDDLSDLAVNYMQGKIGPFTFVLLISLFYPGIRGKSQTSIEDFKGLFTNPPTKRFEFKDFPIDLRMPEELKRVSTDISMFERSIGESA